MNKKGFWHYLVVIAAILLILFGLGIIKPDLSFNMYLKNYKYLTDVKANPSNVSQYESVEISFSVYNPEKYSVDGKVSIKYNDTLWDTSNYYVRAGNFIDLGRIGPSETKKYSVSFNPRINRKSFSESTFIISIHDGESNPVESREVKVYGRK